MSEKTQGEVKIVEVETLRKVLQKFSDDIGKANRDIGSNRLGKVLTIVDSSIADETQRKAMKDLIHDAWYAAIHNQRIYPQLYQATEALGFTLWNESLVTIPVEATSYNPYKELVK